MSLHNWLTPLSQELWKNSRIKKTHGVEKLILKTTTKQETPWETEGRFETVCAADVFICRGQGSARGWWTARSCLEKAWRKAERNSNIPSLPRMYQNRSISELRWGDRLMKTTGWPANLWHWFLFPLPLQIPGLMDNGLGSGSLKVTSLEISGITLNRVIFIKWSDNKWGWLKQIPWWCGLPGFLLKFVWRVTHMPPPHFTLADTPMGTRAHMSSK